MFTRRILPVWRSRCRGARARMLALLGPLLFTLFVCADGIAPAVGAAGTFREEELRFTNGGVTLSGTVLVPEGSPPDRKSAIVLVHGAGPGPREQYRQEAEAFARAGVVTLIYDKRTAGYSQLERSYELLAGDALEAVRALRARPDVAPHAVGLWGLSEGGWVVPIAAARSPAVAFVVLVAATGVPPAQQHAWYLENELRRQGVDGSLVAAFARTWTRQLAGAGLFAEAHHDPVPSLEGVRQPVLALWGAHDRVEPAAESARIVREALERGGNTRYTLRFFPDAEHGLRVSPDGFIVHDRLAPGYPELVTSWIAAVAGGQAPGPSADRPPTQERPSRPLAPLAWWEAGWVQLGAMASLVLVFGAYLAVATGAALVWPGAPARPRPGPARWGSRPVGRWPGRSLWTPR